MATVELTKKEKKYAKQIEKQIAKNRKSALAYEKYSNDKKAKKAAKLQNYERMLKDLLSGKLRKDKDAKKSKKADKKVAKGKVKVEKVTPIAKGKKTAAKKAGRPAKKAA